MLTVYSDDHQLHRGTYELSDGELLPCFETPERADLVLKSVQQAALGDIVEPEIFGLDPVLRVHDPLFVEFLQEAWDLWAATGRTCDALPLNWPVRGMRQIVPEHVDGKLSYYSFLITAVEELSVFIFVAVVTAAILGNWLGSLIVNRINDKTFKSAGRLVMLVIGAIYFGKGVFELL